MLSIKKALQIKPVFILSVDYNAGSIGEMVGENRDLNKYLAEMTIQYKWKNDLTLIDQACLAFTVECLVSVNDGLVTIDEMNTSSDNQSVYTHNIEGLIDGHVTIGEYGCIDIDYHDMLQDLIEKQPIYDVPNNFTIEAY